jgi:hypothetical protein
MTVVVLYRHPRPSLCRARHPDPSALILQGFNAGTNSFQSFVSETPGTKSWTAARV